MLQKEKESKPRSVIVNGERKTVHDISLDVWVIFLMDEIKLVKQIQTYPLWSFGAELGGYTGMFLGVSLMQVTLQLQKHILAPTGAQEMLISVRPSVRFKFV